MNSHVSCRGKRPGNLDSFLVLPESTDQVLQLHSAWGSVWTEHIPMAEEDGAESPPGSPLAGMRCPISAQVMQGSYLSTLLQ